MIDDLKTPPMDDELKNYIERHRYWQNLALDQFSFANNLFLTISLGYLAYLFDKEKTNILSIISILISVFVGAIVVISRLYDLRISRHIALTRQRYYRKKRQTLPDYDFPKPNMCNKISAIIRVIFCGVDILTKKETLNLRSVNLYMNKFNSLRKLSNTLGYFSWNGLKLQLLFLFLACVLYAGKI